MLIRGADGSCQVVESRDFRVQRRRPKPGQHVSGADKRTESEKDRGRVAYSPFLRRLSGVTQVTTPTPDAPRLHTRESHSQKVSLVAREIAEGIVRQAEGAPESEMAQVLVEHGGLDVTSCEAAGLAHDLGHPPFGHSGEVALNTLLRRNGVSDGFEGNAQTFRIISHLDRRKIESGHSGLGMNLTRVTMAAVLKYPYLCPPEALIGGGKGADYALVPPKFGAYIADKDAFSFAAELSPSDTAGNVRQTLEASIMDLADDIAYSTHDFEDFYRDGRLDLPRIARDLDDADEWISANSLDSVLDDSAGTADNAFIKFGAQIARKHDGYFDTEEYIEALRRVHKMVSTLRPYDDNPLRDADVTMSLSRFLEGMFSSVAVTREPAWQGGPSVYLTGASWYDMQCLKTVTKRYVVGSARMALIERAQGSIMTTLFEGLVSWVADVEPKALPEPLQSYVLGAQSTADSTAEQLRLRAIADYICSLSDAECFTMSSWLAGKELPRFRTI